MPSTQPSLRLQILSDVHLSRGNLPVPDTGADLLILAGDISRPHDAIAWAQSLNRPALYVTGNHEHYGSSINATHATIRQLCQQTSPDAPAITLLDQEQYVFGGVRFLGATLWTDFSLYGNGQQREEAIANGLKYNRDFSRIQSDVNPQRLFSPEDSCALFKQHSHWLKQQLATPFDGPTVVITHHAPSPKSIHARFAGSPANPGFVNNLEALMSGSQVALWVHGHTHNSFDYNVNGTRVVCNPRGYLGTDGSPENPEFDPALVVQV